MCHVRLSCQKWKRGGKPTFGYDSVGNFVENSTAMGWLGDKGAVEAVWAVRACAVACEKAQRNSARQRNQAHKLADLEGAALGNVRHDIRFSPELKVGSQTKHLLQWDACIRLWQHSGTNGLDD